MASLLVLDMHARTYVSNKNLVGLHHLKEVLKLSLSRANVWNSVIIFYKLYYYKTKHN